jgi:hypothetical protein
LRSGSASGWAKASIAPPSSATCAAWRTRPEKA